MYLILILPLISGITAQILKFFFSSYKFSWKNLIAYSGMPSGHSAIVVSLAMITGLIEGWHSPLFAITAILAVLIIRDALGLRKYLGQHGKILNVLVKDLKNDKVLDEKYPHLIEKIGHTPMQVLAGALIGVVISLIGFLIYN